MEQKKIVRTFKFYTITVKDSKTQEILKSEIVTAEPKKDKVAIKFIKETGRTDFVVDIQSTEEVREISFDKFIEHSTVVTPKGNDENSSNNESEVK